MLVFSQKEYLKSLAAVNKKLHEKLKEIPQPSYDLIQMVRLHDEELKSARKCRSFARELEGVPRNELLDKGYNIKPEWCVEKPLSKNEAPDYALYDTKDGDVCVCMGKVWQLAKYLGVNSDAIYRDFRQGVLAKNRYRVEKIEW